MRNFYLIVFLLTVSVASTAQTIYTSRQSGNWTAASTWTANAVPPLACNCIVRIAPGHNVRTNSTLNMSNITLELQGANSKLEMNGSDDLNLTGNSSIDLQHSGSQIYHTGNANSAANSFITLSGFRIYKGDSIMQSTAPAGVVNGIAHATSAQPGVGFQSGALPVILVEFRVTTTNRSMALIWKTQQENNSDKYIIERSNDGRSWQRIGEVKSAGFSAQPQSYTYSDPDPAKGMNFYRLKIVDKDGRYGYTPVRAGRMVAFNSKLSIYPNPAISTVNVYVNRDNSSQDELTVSLFNRLGQLVIQKKLEANSDVLSFKVDNYPAGDYLVEITGQDGYKQTSKLIITRK